MDRAADKLTVDELDLLKYITAVWLSLLSVLPPEEILRLYLYVYRLSRAIIEARGSIAKITITQVDVLSLRSDKTP